ncbi:hypothetical protein METP3_03023 [Methanosarcinales archaeon]|nr:hypothetical protein METP3_03023 [Methanosarcinales archaeon]
MALTPPPTITKEEVLANYNEEHGSNLTFADLGKQLAMKELMAHRRKMLQAAIVEEVII